MKKSCRVIIRSFGCSRLRAYRSAMVALALGACLFTPRLLAQQPSGPPVEAAPQLSAARGDIILDKNLTKESDLIAIGHSIDVEGHAKRGVAALSGSVVIRGVVDGDVAALGGDVWLAPEAAVGGDLVVLGGRLFYSPGAHVGGKILSTTYFREELGRAFLPGQRTIRASFSRTMLLWRSARVLGWFIIAVLAVLLAPVQTAFAMDRFERDFARIAVIGFFGVVVFIGLVAVSSLMIKIIIGIPLVFFLLVSLFAMWAFGAVAFYLTVGRWMARWLFKRPLPMALYALLGLIVWSSLSFIPIVNLFIPYLVFIFALGISIATKFGTGKPWFLRTVQ